MNQYSIDRNGEAMKAIALKNLTSIRRDLVTVGQRILIRRLLAVGFATADDIRQCLNIPGTISPKFVGAIPGQLARLGLIVADGFVKSERVVAHARPLTRWRLVDRAGAEAWLAANAEPAGPKPDLFDNCD